MVDIKIPKRALEIIEKIRGKATNKRENISLAGYAGPGSRLKNGVWEASVGRFVRNWRGCTRRLAEVGIINPSSCTLYLFKSLYNAL